MIDHKVRALLAVLAMGLMPLCALPARAAPPLPGAIFTTDSTCTGTNLNIYSYKGAVYLDGGPAHTGAAGLPDGSYYVRVTDPDGTVLGTSVGALVEKPVAVSGGEFTACVQLSAILIRPDVLTVGYNDTGNPGGEYKVWVSSVSTFDNDSTKTDNFKVKAPVVPGPPPQATLRVKKYYDANTNGVRDPDEPYITGWKVEIVDTIDLIRFTPVVVVVDPDDYTVTEFAPLETNWLPTTDPSVDVTLVANDDKTVEFGNVCLGAGGGLTLGFWSNRNGQALFGADDLALMVGLNLRNANGTAFDPASYTAFRTWILGASATNMAYMLSAQLAAMELNVLNGKVTGTALIYAPGATSANALGFASVTDIMAEANASLGANGLTIGASATRTYQEGLKTALDQANNNLTFVQGTPCPFSF